MEDTLSVACLIDSTTSKIQQLQKAFTELESHRAVTLNLKWKELEEHFHGLEKSLKRRFHQLEDQEKEYENKTREAQELLEQKAAAVAAKEQDSLARLQEKRDAAISTITGSLENLNKISYEVPVADNSEGENSVLIVQENGPDCVGIVDTAEDIKRSPEIETLEVRCYPQLVTLCEEMDSEGLHRFISDNRKNLAALKEEIPFALKAAGNPASLVLDSLKGFYHVDNASVDVKKDSNLLGLRRTCIMLMECLSVLLMTLDMASIGAVISEDIQRRAKAIAEGWTPSLEGLDVDASNGNSLEAHAFLQLLSTFRIASNFAEEDLSRLIPMVSRRRQTADLCRSLGLSEKMPGVVEVLVNSGRQIDAVNLAFAFDLKEQFSPVPLLKSYLKEARRASSQCKPGNASPTAQNDVNERELTALKIVIKCIEEHNLEDQYSIEPLQKKVIQLEKAKADRKRATEASKPQPKRPRANGAGQRTDKTFYPRATQYVYDNRPFVYHGPTDNRNPPPVAAYNFPPSHGNFFGNCYQYQAAYLH